MRRPLRLSRAARADMRALVAYVAEAAPERADWHFRRLTRAIAEIGEQPFRWTYFFATGEPLRARLFLLGRTTFWIVYEVTPEAVAILRVWNSRQNPEDFNF